MNVKAASNSPKSSVGSTIRVVSIRTGLPMETLRAWERRYGFPKPERRAGSNRRLYATADVERLMAIARTIERGYRVGDVVHMPPGELAALTVSHALKAEPATLDVGVLIERLRVDDVVGVEDGLRHAAATLGARRFVTEVAHPFAVGVGDAWAEGRLEVRHEHIATECLTTQLRHMLTAYQDVTARPSVLLATLPGEPHTLALQMVALYLAISGAKPRLLGASTPPEQLARAATSLRADVVGITVTPVSDRKETRAAVRTLAKLLPQGVPVWVGGGAASSLGVDREGVRLFASWESIDEALESWRENVGRGR